MQKLLARLQQNSDMILAVGLIGIVVPLFVYIWKHQFNLAGQLFVLLGFALLGLYVALEYPRIANALKGRQVRYGGNALLMILLFIGILAMVAFLGQRYSKRVDLTANRVFSISEQTVKVLDNLDQPVKIWAFYAATSSRTDVETLLKAYANGHSGKISYEFVDPDAKPTLAKQYGLVEGDTDILVLEKGDKKQKVSGSAEGDITSALVKISRGQPKVVYLLAGHGERSPDDSGQEGILLAKQALEKDNYTVKSLNLAVAPSAAVTTTTSVTSTAAVTVTVPTTGTQLVRQFSPIPSDAAALVIAAPTTAIPDGEWQILSKWLTDGGKLFILQDPLDSPTGMEDALLANWGMLVDNDLVIDVQDSLQSDPSALAIQRGTYSPITKDVRSQILLPGARSVEVPQSPAQGTTYTPLALTSSQSWGETDLAGLSRGVKYDAGKDILGPLAVAVSVERDAAGGAKARLIVFGNSLFMSDRFLNMGGNLDLFVNAVNWLTEDETLIGIRARAPEDRSLYLPPSDAKLLAFGSVLGLPLLVLGLGALLWWRRR
jgi:ABC-type uncharacterized transport system involved in gliding motility auxiliary subunit